MSLILGRRAVVGGLAGGLLTGCDRIANTPAGGAALESGSRIHGWLQRALNTRGALVPEFTPEQMSPIFRSNGTRNPNTPAYNALAAGNFADWRIAIDGLVGRPLTLSLGQLREIPARTQITRHDCVEGWSAIGQWTGPRLSVLLDAARLSDRARYIVFHCADRFGATPYYESVDLVDAFHPQTILAWAMNGHPLSIPNGAPVRLRVERQLGYKHAKYVHRIEAIASLDGIGAGKGGYWEDVADYDWYAGI